MNTPDHTLAPIALFAYKRPSHLRRTLEALQRDPLFARSAVHIFCDGARSEADHDLVGQTRDVARAFATPLTHLVFKDRNQGLRRSIVDGVTELTEAHGRVIVIEDDLVVGDQFLTFMNAALDRYAENPAVFQVSGHQFPVALGDGDRSLFLPFTTTWGWATWKRAWQHFDASGEGYRRLLDDRLLRYRFDFDGSYPYFKMLQKQQAGEIDSWGISWYLSVFNHDGLVLFPSKTLVLNEGFDGSGTHSNIQYEKNLYQVDFDVGSLKFPDEIAVDQLSFKKIKKYLRGKSGVSRKIVSLIKNFLRGWI